MRGRLPSTPSEADARLLGWGTSSTEARQEDAVLAMFGLGQASGSSDVAHLMVLDICSRYVSYCLLLQNNANVQEWACVDRRKAIWSKLFERVQEWNWTFPHLPIQKTQNSYEVMSGSIQKAIHILVITGGRLRTAAAVHAVCTQLLETLWCLKVVVIVVAAWGGNSDVEVPFDVTCQAACFPDSTSLGYLDNCTTGSCATAFLPFGEFAQVSSHCRGNGALSAPQTSTSAERKLDCIESALLQSLNGWCQRKPWWNDPYLSWPSDMTMIWLCQMPWKSAKKEREIC